MWNMQQNCVVGCADASRNLQELNLTKFLQDPTNCTMGDFSAGSLLC